MNTAAASRRVALMTFIGGVGGGIVFPILPALGLQLGIGGAMIGLILSANRITRLAFDPVAGRLVDRLGGKVPLAAGLLIEPPPPSPCGPVAVRGRGGQRETPP